MLQELLKTYHENTPPREKNKKGIENDTSKCKQMLSAVSVIYLNERKTIASITV